jgi:hypothetical protein
MVDVLDPLVAALKALNPERDRTALSRIFCSVIGSIGSLKGLTSEALRIGVQRVIDRRPQFYEQYQYAKVIRLPGI